jgi:hypothetical protein
VVYEYVTAASINIAPARQTAAAPSPNAFWTVRLRSGDRAGGNNTPGGGHAGVNSPIAVISSSNDGVIRDNVWQVGLSGWHIDRSWHIIQESNVYTGYLSNDPTRPLPNFDGSFWFSSYGQGPFPGAGRFFYGNTTQNERPHTKPQVCVGGRAGGGEAQDIVECPRRAD